MQRKTMVILTVFVLISILSAGVYLLLRPEAATAPTPAVGGASLPAEGYAEHAQYYDITADYPATTSLLATAGPAADAAARTTMLDFVHETVNTFKTEGRFDTLTADDIAQLGLDQERRQTLEITYGTASSSRTVSFIFTIYADTLGAHGNTYFRTFTFDTKTGAELDLGDVFSTGSSFLSTLSVISRTKLPGVIGDSADTEMIQAGTLPTADNFANFYFEDSSFVLLFPPYAVAPYAAGPQTLRIPLSQLSSILKSEYR